MRTITDEESEPVNARSDPPLGAAEPPPGIVTTVDAVTVAPATLVHDPVIVTEPVTPAGIVAVVEAEPVAPAVAEPTVPPPEVNDTAELGAHPVMVTGTLYVPPAPVLGEPAVTAGGGYPACAAATAGSASTTEKAITAVAAVAIRRVVREEVSIMGLL
jgi:hypothetical protein